ncbi:hypothetical protein PFISCL1PPCAC_14496, partial [Pristionchus fissidentatus]
QEMGTYKFLLLTFVINDSLYTLVHFATRPVTSVIDDVFYLFSSRFPERWVISIFSCVHSVSFLILCYHFVYRYFSVSRYELMYLFRRASFVAMLASLLLVELITWFLLVYYLYASDVDSFERIYAVLKEEYPNIHVNSAMTAEYWFSVLNVVIFCSIRIAQHLHSVVSSVRASSLQRQLYYTLLVQFSVPFTIMYLPVLIEIIPPIFHIRLSFSNIILPLLYSVFPALDAIVLLYGVYDYR